LPFAVDAKNKTEESSRRKKKRIKEGGKEPPFLCLCSKKNGEKIFAFRSRGGKKKERGEEHSLYPHSFLERGNEKGGREKGGDFHYSNEKKEIRGV